MKKDWIKHIHDMLADYQSAVPKNLLEDVKSEMDFRGLKFSMPSATKRDSAKTIPLWLRTTAAIAMVVIVGVTAWLVFHDNRKETNQDIVESQSASPDPLSPSVVEAIDSRPVAVSTSRRLVLWTDAQTEVKQPLSESHPGVPEEETTIIPSEQEKDETFVPHSDGKKPTKERNTMERRQVYFPSRQKHGKRQLAFSGYVSGGLGNNSNDAQTTLFSTNTFGDATVPTENIHILYAVRNNELLSSTVDSYSSVDHHEPIKAGVSLRIPVSSRWSVTTGLTYSYLTSDFIYGSDETATERTQKLHYLGIPVNVNYSFYRTHRLNLYASAGGEVAKLISGKKETEPQDDGASGTEDVKEGRPQFSTNLSLGAEYRIVDKLSLYAEPGVTYYIDNGSDVENIYKDKSFNFNLQVGLRWTLR